MDEYLLIIKKVYSIKKITQKIKKLKEIYEE